MIQKERNKKERSFQKKEKNLHDRVMKTIHAVFGDIFGNRPPTARISISVS